MSEEEERWEVLMYLRRAERATADMVARELGISKERAEFHLEKLLENKMIDKTVGEVPPYYIYRKHVGISITFNIKTKSEGRPELDITCTIQTVIAPEEERGVLSIVKQLFEEWLIYKFGAFQARAMTYETGVDHWSPTFEEIKKFESKYAFYWSWERPGKSEELEGEELKWNPIPTGAIEWAEARKGRKPREEKEEYEE